MADMRKSKFSDEQIIGFLKQAEAGLSVAEICRNGGAAPLVNSTPTDPGSSRISCPHKGLAN
jgi:hypothetical protein